jgi:hypothetical protein
MEKDSNTLEFYAKLMKRCWDHDPENRPTVEEIDNCLFEYHCGRITKEKFFY